MAERLLTAKSLAPYQQASYRLNVCEVTEDDPYADGRPYLTYSIRDGQGELMISSRSTITSELAIDIIHAIHAAHEDGRQQGRIEKTAEIRKALEINS